jgi:hypothetical protein
MIEYLAPRLKGHSFESVMQISLAQMDKIEVKKDKESFVCNGRQESEEPLAA